MWTTVNIEKNEDVILQKINDVQVQIIKLDKLNKVRIVLKDSNIVVNYKSLSYIKGNIEVIHNSEEGTISTLKDILFGGKKISNYNDKIILYGSGEVNLEFTEQPLVLIELIDEEVIVWNEMFCCAEDGIEINKFNEDIVSIDEEFIEEKSMMRLKGSGLVVLKLPTLNEEYIKRTKIYKDKIMLNKDYAILRSNNIKFNIEDFGEDMINTYVGTGEVWHIPSKEIYLESVLIEKEKCSNDDKN